MVTLDGSRRKRYCVGVPKTARIDRLKQALAELSGIKADRLVIAELWQYKLHNVFEVSGVWGVFARCGGSGSLLLKRSRAQARSVVVESAWVLCLFFLFCLVCFLYFFCLFLLFCFFYFFASSASFPFLCFFCFFSFFCFLCFFLFLFSLLL